LGPSSVRSVVDEFLRSPAVSRHTGWGAGVQPSELRRSAYRMFEVEWAAQGEARLASKDQPLSRRQAKVAAGIMEELGPELLVIAEVTGALVALVRRECARAGHAVYLDRISGRCCSAATAHIRRHATAPTEDEQDAMVHKVVASVTEEEPRVGPDEFEARYRGLYEEEWASRGALNLEVFPPSLLLLGTDRRPPLVRRDGRSETDICGTDRSIYGRYTSYRPPALGRSVPFRSRAQRCVQPVSLRDRARDVGEEEVRRACLPYGLEHNCHRSVLRGAHFGLTGEWEGRVPAVGEDLGRRCVTLRCADEQNVAETVRALVGRRLRKRTDASVARGIDVDGQHWAVDGDSPLLFAGNHDRMVLVVMRRLWKAVHGLELYVEEHMCSCSLTAVAAVAVDRAVPAALARWDSACDDSDTTESDVHSAGSAALLEAQNRTSELLMRQPPQNAKMLLLLRAGWRSAYLELVADDPGTYLSAEAFAQWCRDVVPGAQDRDGEAS